MGVGPQRPPAGQVHDHRQAHLGVAREVEALPHGARVVGRVARAVRGQRHEPGEGVRQFLERDVVVAEDQRDGVGVSPPCQPLQGEVHVLGGAARRRGRREVAGVDRRVRTVHQVRVVAQAGERPLGVEEGYGQVQVGAVVPGFRPVQEQSEHGALGKCLDAAAAHGHQDLGGGPLGERHGEVGQSGVQHRQLVGPPGGEPAQQFPLQQGDHLGHRPGGQGGAPLGDGQGPGDVAPREEHASGPGAVLGACPQRPERRQQRARAHLRQPVPQGLLQLRHERLVGVQAQQHVQAAHQFAGPLPGEGRGPGGVPLGHRLLQPARPGGRADSGAVRAHGVRVRGGRGQQGGAEGGVRVQRCGAQHGGGERGARVPGVPLEGVQHLRGPLPRRGVPQHVLDQVRRRQSVEDGEQVTPQGTGNVREPCRCHQPGVAAREHGEQPQHVGGGGEPLGEQPPQGRPRRCPAHQRAQDQRLGLADRDVLRQVAPAGRRERQQGQQVVPVLRGERGAAGQQGVHRRGGVGGHVGAQAQQSQRARYGRPGGADGTDRTQEGVVPVDPAVAQRASRVVRAVPAQPADQVRAG